jgi:hypothetical protein
VAIAPEECPSDISEAYTLQFHGRTPQGCDAEVSRSANGFCLCGAGRRVWLGCSVQVLFSLYCTHCTALIVLHSLCSTTFGQAAPLILCPTTWPLCTARTTKAAIRSHAPKHADTSRHTNAVAGAKPRIAIRAVGGKFVPTSRAMPWYRGMRVGTVSAAGAGGHGQSDVTTMSSSVQRSVWL